MRRPARAGSAGTGAGAAFLGHLRTGHVQRTAAGALALAAVAAVLSGCGAGAAAIAQHPIAPVRVPATELARLPRATTYANVPAAPIDPAPTVATSGLIVHPRAAETVYAAPGRAPVTVLPTSELGGPTWVPVVQTRPGWERVLLPTRPNGASGWIYTGAGAQVDTERSTYLVRIWVGARRLSLYDSGRALGTWTVAVGAPGTVTPTGRTFVLASLIPVNPTYTPLILPLGFHSDTLDTFGGGPGTVGLHGWPDPSVFGRAVSHGCVRVPAAALTALSKVPLGTLVLIAS